MRKLFIGVGIALTLFVAIGFASWMIGASKIYEREAFDALVYDKPPDKVRLAIGSPADTITSGFVPGEVWVYHRRTINPRTRKRDEKVLLHFRNGHVALVDWPK